MSRYFNPPQKRKPLWQPEQKNTSSSQPKCRFGDRGFGTHRKINASSTPEICRFGGVVILPQLVDNYC